MNELHDRIGSLPLIAILRGITPDSAVEIGEVLLDAGLVAIEVPLNSPEPLESIRHLAEAFAGRALIGAGTVLSADAVPQIAEAGGRLIVMPHADPDIVREAKRCGLFCVPGVATPTEAFAALEAGADALKLFPAEALPPAVLKAWRAVLPQDCWLLPVGGITPERMASYLIAGANGFGLGSALFKPGMGRKTVARNARAFAAAYSRATAQA